MNLGHDRCKLIGFTELTGIYMKLGKAYLTNITKMPKTKEEFFVFKGDKKEAVQISFAGHVTDFAQLLEKLPKVKETKIEL